MLASYKYQSEVCQGVNVNWVQNHKKYISHLFSLLVTYVAVWVIIYNWVKKWLSQISSVIPCIEYVRILIRSEKKINLHNEKQYKQKSINHYIINVPFPVEKLKTQIFPPETPKKSCYQKTENKCPHVLHSTERLEQFGMLLMTFVERN